MNGTERFGVVHIITKLELGGAQINTLYTCAHLDPARFDVHLFHGPGGMLTPDGMPPDHTLEVPTLVRRLAPWSDLRALFFLVKRLRRLRPALVHTHSSKAGILGRWAARIAGVPVIVHSVHGFSFSPFQSTLKRLFFQTAERWTAPITTHFVFVAAADREAARALKLSRGNDSLIRSGFPFPENPPDPGRTAALREQYGLRERFVCGVIAPFKPQKGLFHLLDIARLVCARHPRVVFFLAGDGALRPQLEAEIQRLGLQENFRLPGFQRQMPEVVPLFDMGVSTALWEGLPQSLVQMRLAKRAVVASDIPGNREVIRDGENGFLVSLDDHRAFAERICTLIEDPTLLNRLAAFSGETFDEWRGERMVQRQEELYTELLAARKKK